MVELVAIDDVQEDQTNPRKFEPDRGLLLRLSVGKLGFLTPLYATADGLLLSGHQRKRVTRELDLAVLPVERVDLKVEQIKGINILFNRATNDFGAFDTGAGAQQQIRLQSILDRLQAMPDLEAEDWPVLRMKEEPLAPLAAKSDIEFDKKAVVTAESLMAMGIRIPVVATTSGKVVNGVYRMLAALGKGVTTWPVVRVSDEVGDLVHTMLNYLSMDFHVESDFADLLRACAFRRPQNNRGAVPKAMRFWANGCKTLLDRDSYSVDYWANFRTIHGHNVLDFGAGLCKAAPFLRERDINAVDFEPYRIDFDSESGEPSVELSISKAREFLAYVADPAHVFDSIFLCSVLNSIPFPKDRMMVLCIVHALCHVRTGLYGTCRDISDYKYEYSGIRQANYFVFDSEDGVRIGDVVSNPKIQKFHTTAEATQMLGRFFTQVETWPGGNVFYFRAQYPRGVNTKALRESLEFEFNLPFKDGRRMGLGAEAVRAFESRLGVKL